MIVEYKVEVSELSSILRNDLSQTSEQDDCSCLFNNLAPGVVIPVSPMHRINNISRECLV